MRTSSPARGRRRVTRAVRQGSGRRGEKRYDLICRTFMRRRARRAQIRAPPRMSALRCPSVPALVLGDARQTSGQSPSVGAFATTLVADESFLAAARKQGAPAARKRFAPECVENDCAHWSGGGCALLDRIGRLLREAGAPVRPSAAYDCGIRQNCRWRRERGDEACGVCSLVSRDPLEPPGATQKGFQVDSGVNFR